MRYTHEHYDKTGMHLPFNGIAVLGEDGLWRDENDKVLKVFEWTNLPRESQL